MAVKTKLAQKLSLQLFNNKEDFTELLEDIHMTVFFIMVTFIVQVCACARLVVRWALGATRLLFIARWHCAPSCATSHRHDPAAGLSPCAKRQAPTPCSVPRRPVLPCARAEGLPVGVACHAAAR